MRSIERTAVALHPADGTETKTVLLPLNRNGQLPVVLVDPVDSTGLVVPGMWLSHDVEGTVYNWTKQSREPSGGMPGEDPSRDESRARAVIVDSYVWRSVQSQLAFLRVRDALTGLPNRSQLVDRMDQALSRPGSAGRTALLFIDLDHFSQVNNSLGHDAGDAILLYTAQQIAAVTRVQDTIARLGGDEFLVLCEDTDADGAGVIAERIVKVFRRPVNITGQELRITASVGITNATRDHNPADLLREADAAMHHAKDQGRNQSSQFETSHSHKVSRLLDLEPALRRALERKEFVLFFQPIHNIADGSLQGVEALVRWNRPGHGLVPPDEFIPIAEYTGLIVPLGAWVLNEALGQLSTWKRSNSVPADFSVSVNLSPVQLLDRTLVDTIKRTLAEHHLDPSDLTLEMTETALIADRSRMQATVTALAEAGASLSIDDFGTGYSSLAYLRYLPAKQLKVDRSFVAGLTTNTRDAALVAAVIGLAHEFGMTCVAEGVETAEQLERLRHLGCDLAQGYFLGRPAPADDLTHAWQVDRENSPPRPR